MGSSAGGHLASQALVAWHTYESDVSLRPDFGIMCYPVIASQGPYAHAGSMRNLAGQDPSSETLNMLSSDLHVGPDTPPCFLWHTGEDAAVPLENSMLFASALRAREFHLNCTYHGCGQHGLGLATPFDWGAQCLRWIGEITEWAARASSAGASTCSSGKDRTRTAHKGQRAEVGAGAGQVDGDDATGNVLKVRAKAVGRLAYGWVEVFWKQSTGHKDVAIHDVYGQRGNHQGVAPHAQDRCRSAMSGQAVAVEKVTIA